MNRHITKVTSNIKKGVEVELGPKTIIVGRNGSGKTSIIQAVELALTQQVTDLTGKELVKKPGELIKLGSDGVLEVQCELSDGHEISVFSKKTARGATKPKVEGGVKASMPYHQVRGNLSGSPEVARTWLMASGIGHELDLPDILNEIDGDFQETYKKEVGRKRIAPMVRLQQVIAQNKEAIKSCRNEIKVFERSVEHAAGSVNESISRSHSTLTNLQLAEVEARKKLKIAETNLEGVAFKREQKRKFEQNLRELKDHLEVGENNYHHYKVQAEAQPVFPDEVHHLMEVAKLAVTLNEAHLELESTSCWACGDPGDPAPESVLHGFVTRQQEMKRAIELYTQATMVHHKFKEARDHLMVLQGQSTQLCAAIQGFTKELENHPTENVEELRLMWSQVHAQLQEAQTAVNQHEKIANEKRCLLDAQKKLDFLKRYGTELSRVATTMLDRAKSDFIETVQRLLPSRYEFGMELTERSCEFGFRNGVGLKTALSGAEWASMVLAVSMVCSDPTNELVVVTPEERAFDATTLSEVMASFGGSEHQVILTSTIAPTSVPEGWTVVNLGG